MSSLRQSIDIDVVRQALQIDMVDIQQAQLQMAPTPRRFDRSSDREGQPKVAAVLVLLYPAPNHDLAFALMRRPDYDGAHGGQISLPGGRQEGSESLVETALRETCEELGICDGIEILGSLGKVYIPPSDFEVYPTVGWRSEHPHWQPNPGEVAEVIEAPLSALLDSANKRRETRQFGTLTMTVPYYLLQGHKVWGATAAMLSELEYRLRHTLQLPE